MSIKKLRFLPDGTVNNYESFMRSAFHTVFGKNVWLRPSVNNKVEISRLLNKLEDNDDDYIEFLMHSSEFMPGGTGYFRNENDIENLYKYIDILFDCQKYEGLTRNNYYNKVIDNS